MTIRKFLSYEKYLPKYTVICFLWAFQVWRNTFAESFGESDLWVIGPFAFMLPVAVAIIEGYSLVGCRQVPDSAGQGWRFALRPLTVLYILFSILTT